MGRPARSDADGRAHQAALSEERGPIPGLPIGNAAGRLSALQHGSGSDSTGGQSPHSRHTPACRRARDSLESNPSTRQQWRFYGFLTGYLTSISGHRCGVFQNLTIQEVEEASRSPDESAYVINAKNAHSSEDRRKVAQFMCHDTSTSDKFYALHLGPLQARERSRLFERALVEEEEDGEAAGTESPPRKGRKRTETPVSPLEGTSRRTLPWRPARGKSQGARPLEQTEDSESS
ncbi:uncharacterized protein [Danio rerio]|uniref:Uncharacterized protein n=1 Tax=Danio rerio TaxID=7955 RepID=A0AC58HWP8_DANRE